MAPIRALVVAAFTAVFVILPVPASQAAPVPGSSPSAYNGYALGTDHLSFDKAPDVGNGWEFNQKLHAIDDNFLAVPDLWVAECENTTGPCVHVQEVCLPDADFMYQWDRDFYGSNPKHGRMRLNRCPTDDRGRDISASCRAIMTLLGSHDWPAPNNNTCLDDPWFLSEDNASNADFDALNTAYNFT